MGALTAAMFSGVGNSVAIESEEKNYSDMIKFDFMYMWITGWCATCLLCLFHRWFAMRSPDSDSVQYPGCSYLNRINLYLYQSLFCFPFDDTHPENLGYD